MALAPVGYTLWSKFLRYDPKHADWPNRDRFVLSVGHASMLLYAVLLGVVGLLAGIGLGLANAMLNPECTRPGSSGGCAIGVGVFGMLLGALGLPAGAIAGLIHGLIGRHG